MNKTTAPRVSVPGIAYLSEAFTKMLEQIDKDPEAAGRLEDNELLAANAWTAGENVTIAAETRRRRQHHEQQARRFATHEHTELVPILAERAKS